MYGVRDILHRYFDLNVARCRLASSERAGQRNNGEAEQNPRHLGPLCVDVYVSAFPVAAHIF